MADPDRGRERGVAMLEFALVAGFLFLLFSGVVDYGMGWRRSTEVSGTLRNAVRVAANLGDTRSTDLDALRALRAGVAEFGNTNVRRVVIYRSTTANGAVPAACRTAPMVDTASTTGNGVSTGSGAAAVRCNIYGPTQLENLEAAASTRFAGNATACQGGATSNTDWDRFYCPVTGRESDQAIGADYVGVYIEVSYQPMMGLVSPNVITIRDSVVMRIEPRLDS